MQVKSIAVCSKGSILQYFRLSLSYQLLLRSLFCLFLSGCFTQVLLYTYSLFNHTYLLSCSMVLMVYTLAWALIPWLNCHKCHKFICRHINYSTTDKIRGYSDQYGVCPSVHLTICIERLVFSAITFIAFEIF